MSVVELRETRRGGIPVVWVRARMAALDMLYAPVPAIAVFRVSNDDEMFLSTLFTFHSCD